MHVHLRLPSAQLCCAHTLRKLLAEVVGLQCKQENIHTERQWSSLRPAVQDSGPGNPIDIKLGCWWSPECIDGAISAHMCS